LAESDDELRTGRGFGPFDTAAQMVADMKARLKSIEDDRYIVRDVIPHPK
jgi:hypothetical protein